MDEEKKPDHESSFEMTGNCPNIDGSSSCFDSTISNYFYLNDCESSVLCEFGWNHNLQVEPAEIFDGTTTRALANNSFNDRPMDFIELVRSGGGSSSRRLPESLPNNQMLVVDAASTLMNNVNPAAASLVSSSSSDDPHLDNTGSERKPPADKSIKGKKKGPKRVRQPRYAFKTKTDIDLLEDGYRWRKYGQKAVKNSPYPRSYYRCTNSKCAVKKRVERSSEDPTIVVTTYEGHHCHHTVGFPHSAGVFTSTTYCDPDPFSDCQINMHSSTPQWSSLFYNPQMQHPLETPSHLISSSTESQHRPHERDQLPGRRQLIIRQEPSMQKVPSSSSTTDQGLLGDIVTAEMRK